MSVRRLFYPHFLLKKRDRKSGFFFGFFSLVCSFVYSLFGVVLFALHVLLPYSRTDGVHFKRFY